MSINFYASRDIHDLRYMRECPAVSYANGNAAAVIRALGLVDGPCGECEIAAFLRATVHVLNTTKAVERNTRAEFSDGRVHTAGLDAEGIRRRVRELQDFALDAAEKGAKAIYWG